MFITFFISILVTAYVTAELPSYLHPCGRKEPNYDQCIANNVENLKDKICIGIPELNVLPNEPLIIKKLVIYDAPNTKLYLRDGKISGFCDFVVNSVHGDPDKLHYDFDLFMKHLRMNTTYDFDIRLLVDIAHKGIVHVTMDNVRAKIGIDMKIITKNDKKYIYISKMNTILTLTEFTYKFDESEKEMIQLHEIINNVIQNDKKNIVSKVKPALEETVTKRIISILNDAFYTRYEEIFPERT